MASREFTHLPLGPWPKGLANTLRSTEYPDDVLKDAVNVNIRRDGTAVTRLSWEQVLPGEAHSLHRHDGRVFAVVDNDLGELDDSGFTALMAGTGRVNWTELNGNAVFATSEAVYEIDGSAVQIVSGLDRDELDLDDELVPLPGGQWVDYWNGRLIVARGASLLFSEPLRYGAHNPMTGYVRFSTRVEWVAPLEDGIYVGLRGSVVFLQGNTPSQLSQTRVAQGSSPGMALTIAGEHLSQELAATPRVAVFFTPSGFTLGLPNGRVVYPQNDAVRNLPLFRGKLLESGGRLYAVRGF